METWKQDLLLTKRSHVAPFTFLKESLRQQATPGRDMANFTVKSSKVSQAYFSIILRQFNVEVYPSHLNQVTLSGSNQRHGLLMR